MANAAPKLEMVPPAGERLLRFVGDRVRFGLGDAAGGGLPDGWQARLRTNLGRGAVLRREIIHSRAGEKPVPVASWRDVPMRRSGGEWSVELTLTEVGYFKAKAYAVDGRGWQFWPEGPDLGLNVQPDAGRGANTIYCAFTRLFGVTRAAVSTVDRRVEETMKGLDKQGYTVIPPSGKLRDVAAQLPHIVDELGCRIVHLLPVNPTPATYARFGRYGSPYAGLDLTAIDPALVEFDRRTTATEQFQELAFAVHARGARLFLDLVINHTGWSSTLQEQHPEWFLRRPDGTFVNPGAWGVTWEDLVELDPDTHALWDHLADAFLTWCRRGVDGFRCDAGYKVPMPVWQFITARVREEFPSTIFLLEGLGGGWNETEALLTEGGMQWAYSELFQEFSGPQVAGYLDHAHKQSRRVGVLAHYSETHDNDRLAKKGRAWSLLRNRLCALASVNGAFGFTCGVEWLATEKILVHGRTGLAWGAPDNLISELSRLNQLLSDHPSFFDGASLTRLSPAESPVLALQRVSADGDHAVLVLINSDAEKSNALALPAGALDGLPGFTPGALVDLLDQPPPKHSLSAEGTSHSFTLGPAACHCLAPAAAPARAAGFGTEYRRARAQAAWAVRALQEYLDPEKIGPFPWRGLAARVDSDPARFLGSLAWLEPERASRDLIAALEAAADRNEFPRVIHWGLLDRRRVTLVPPEHWILIRDDVPFRVSLHGAGDETRSHAESIAVGDGHIASFPPCPRRGDAELTIERYGLTDTRVTGTLRFLPPLTSDLSPLTSDLSPPTSDLSPPTSHPSPLPGSVVLLTNGIGGMARLCVDVGRIQSKYDCLLGANLNPEVPVDRHVFAKRARVWANVNGFISPLNADTLAAFDPGPPARWRFAASAGDGAFTGIEMTAEMVPDRNATVLTFRRVASAGRASRESMPAAAGAESGSGDRAEPVPVRLTVRVDIEDRNFHWETQRNLASEQHFEAGTRPLPDRPGFVFAPAADRQLSVVADAGEFHPQPEWCQKIPHPIEAGRGQNPVGDAYSPGWFDLPLGPGGTAVTFLVTAEPEVSPADRRRPSAAAGAAPASNGASPDRNDRAFSSRLARAVRDFVVRRGEGKTVIAGYPWFLDWGRDTLICARGLLAAGCEPDVRRILVTFAGFEESGTLPNSIHGDDASNRDTSDAPLWFGVVCEDLAAAGAAGFHSTVVDRRGRTIADVLGSIARNYLSGTPNGIRVDRDSALVWSPAHFTWMDTNFPAGTPREGYPIEIQVLWIRLLRQLDHLGLPPSGERWAALAERAEASLHTLFWLEEHRRFADVRLAGPGVAAAAGAADTALRSNALFAVSLGAVAGDRARQCVDAALRHLVVPGAVRSLAPLPVSPPLPIYDGGGRLLNNPAEPYAGRYEGDEDTRRKPAYHNGTAWTWTFPVFCEALARAWDFSAPAVSAARACLGSLEPLMDEGCLGHLPEILDGDAPHTQRGCDAQAWSATEALRVWQLLEAAEPR